jgi:hypothetical protein
MLTKHLFLSIVLILALALSGCAGATPSTEGKVIIEYHRSGGVLGWDEHLIIRENGKAILTRHGQCHKFNVDDKTLNIFQNRLEITNFSELCGEYLPSEKSSDGIEYTIISGCTVHTMDGAVPESLWPLIEVLNQISTGI